MKEQNTKKVKFSDIGDIIDGLCAGRTILNMLIEEKKISRDGNTEFYEQFLNKVENGRYALDRIRQKLHLDDDPVYRKQY